MTSIHEDTTIGYVKLTIRSLERSLQFYCNVIGFQVLNKTDRQAELTADGKRPLLILEENPSAVVLPERTVTGLYHFAILLPNRKELGIALARLIENGIALGQGDHAVSEALYLSDPDGNGIEMYADRPRSTWQRDREGNYVMTTTAVDIEGLWKRPRRAENNTSKRYGHRAHSSACQRSERSKSVLHRCAGL